MLLRCVLFRFLLVLADDYRACGFAAGFFAACCNHRCTAGFFTVKHRRGSMAAVMIGKDDDLMRLAVQMPRRRRPLRMHGRTRFRSRPVPFIVPEEPAVIIRDVFILVKEIAVFRDGNFLGLCHDDRARRGRDDFLRGDDGRFFHDDRLLDDCRRSFHDDRGRTGLDDRADQIHDIGCQPDAVGRGFVVIPCEGSGRSEDDRRSESSADNDCLVEGLLGFVSLWKRG